MSDDLKDRRELPKRLAAHVDELVAICDAYETQVDELTREIDEDNALREKLTRLLEGTAKGLKDEPPDDVWWDWSDLPALAERYRLALEEIACKAGTPQDVSVIAQKALFKRGGE